MKRFLILLPTMALGSFLHAESSLTEQRPQTVAPLTELKIPGLPPVAPAKPFTFAQPVEKTLANGLRIVFVPRPGLPQPTADAGTGPPPPARRLTGPAPRDVSRRVAAGERP